MTRTLLNIMQHHVVVRPDKTASIEHCDAELYQRLDSHYHGFQGCQLISCFEFEQDWSSWEMHPQGDETVILLSGQATIVLQQQEEEKCVVLQQPGDFVVVPKHTWHSAKTQVKTKLLFITPGEGTEHKEFG